MIVFSDTFDNADSSQLGEWAVCPGTWTIPSYDEAVSWLRHVVTDDDLRTLTVNGVAYAIPTCSPGDLLEVRVENGTVTITVQAAS